MSAISLAGLDLDGSLPSGIGHFSKLVTFSVSNNKIVGTIPDSICDLTNLQTLDLSANLLDGPIPPRFKQLTLLSALKLSNNYLTADGILTPQELPLGTLGGFEDRYCNNCYTVIAGGDVFLCTFRPDCPSRRTRVPTSEPTSFGKSNERCRS